MSKPYIQNGRVLHPYLAFGLIKKTNDLVYDYCCHVFNRMNELEGQLIGAREESNRLRIENEFLLRNVQILLKEEAE